MFKNIPQNRILFYLFLAGLLPILAALFLFFSEKNSLNDLKITLDEVKQKAILLEKKQAINMAVRHHFKDADHFYIDKYLETLTFLEPEIESLQSIVNNKNYVEDDSVKKRIEFLTGSNLLVFSEGVVQTYPLFQETTETLVHPIEIDINDLQKILARVEGVEIGNYSPGPNRPQLIIIDFKLEKKNLSEKNEVFTLNMKLLKREFL